MPAKTPDNYVAEQMVEQQVRTWEVLDDDVLDVMQAVPRHRFLPEKLAAFAYADMSMQLRDDFILPPPSVQGKILQALDLDPDATVLQLGAGSGYLSACLAELSNFVYYVDSDASLLEDIDTVCDELKLTNLSGVNHSLKDVFGEIENKYDAIVMQQALSEVPTELKHALHEQGVAVLFVGEAPVMRCVRIERIAENEWLEEDLFEFVVSPLTKSSVEKVTFAF